MLAAVRDTNVIVSAVLIQGGIEERILRAWEAGRFQLVVSPPILREIRRVLAYEKIRRRRWMTESEAEALLGRLAEGAFLVSGARRVRVCRDPSDDKFLDAALAGRAQYVVTGDPDLTTLETYGEVRIVTPRRFLEILGPAVAPPPSHPLPPASHFPCEGT